MCWNLGEPIGFRLSDLAESDYRMSSESSDRNRPENIGMNRDPVGMSRIGTDPTESDRSFQPGNVRKSWLHDGENRKILTSFLAKAIQNLTESLIV